MHDGWCYVDQWIDGSDRRQTLVCTKTRRSYERKCKEYREDVAALGVLAELVGRRPPKPLAHEAARILAALERARDASATKV